jgi:hypothetical protein
MEADFDPDDAPLLMSIVGYIGAADFPRLRANLGGLHGFPDSSWNCGEGCAGRGLIVEADGTLWKVS